MKILYFNDWRLGVMKGNDVVDVTAWCKTCRTPTPAI